MRKGVAHDGLVGGDGAADDDERQQAAGRIELLVLRMPQSTPYTSGRTFIAMTISSRGIAARSPMPQRVTSGLTGTVLDGAQTVGDGEPEVVVAVHAEHCLVGIRGIFDDAI